MTFNNSILSLAISAALVVPFAQAATKTPTKQTDDGSAPEQAIEVIRVNSDFRSQNLQKTANSLTVIGEEAIMLRNAENLEQLIALAPNVNFASGSQRARYYQIRGIGERSQFKEPINPSVGLMIDDLDFSGMGSIAATFDLGQIDIYRGPQGTRFGASAMAGLIQLNTKPATEQFEAQARVSAGNYHSYGAGLVLSGPINQSTKFRLAAQQYNSDGFINNSYLDRKDTNNQDELTVHGKLNLVLSEHLTLDLAGFYFNFDNGYDAFSLDNTRTTMSDQPGFDYQQSTAFSSRLTYTGFADVETIAIFTHSTSNLDYGYDEDWSHLGLHPWEYSSTDHYFRERFINTAELRLVSKPGAELFNQSTAYTLGAYYKYDDEFFNREYTYLDHAFKSDFAKKTLAAYAQFDSQLSALWSLTTGLRLEKRSADYINSDAFYDAPTDTMAGGKIVLAYQASDSRMVYGQVSRGFKAGGVNTDGSLPIALRTFEPEYILNYEMGYKVNFLEHNQAFARIAAFYMDRSQVQVKSSYDTLRADGSTEFVEYLGNAASGTNKGLELEAGWQVNDRVNLYGSVGLLNTKFVDFVNANGQNLTDRAQAHAPNYQASVGINYAVNEQWLVNLSADSKASFYFSDSHNNKSEPVTLVNANISYQMANWQVSVWARNVFNQDHATRGFYFGNDPRNGYQATRYTQLAEPRVFGITADYHF